MTLCSSVLSNNDLFFRAKGLDVPGMNLGNIKMLETPEDARQIHAASIGRNVVLVGTSFVGTAFVVCNIFTCIITFMINLC